MLRDAESEIALNAAIRSAPTMAAIDRYTGVLYDALDAASLDAPARRWLGANVLIHTAPLGPVGALDRIPAYRLGAGVSLPGAARCGGCGRAVTRRDRRICRRGSCSTCARRRTRRSGRCRHPSRRCTCGS